MKICAACNETLPKDKFSKKQWQLKQQRRCKECIAANRDVTLLKAPAEPLRADGEGEPCVSDEDIFKEPPPKDECPICLLPMPLDHEGVRYKECCGKVICIGCSYVNETENNRKICAFCRAPEANSDKDCIERINKRVEANDAGAMCQLGLFYDRGERGLRQNYKKANKLFHRAGELGNTTSQYNIGISYLRGEGVEKDLKKAKYYWELAAIGGIAMARHNLGCSEWRAGNMNRALKHWMISAAAGYDNSLNAIRGCFLDGHATKDDFENALRAHKEASDEMKSEQREAAAAARSQDDGR